MKAAIPGTVNATTPRRSCASSTRRGCEGVTTSTRSCAGRRSRSSASKEFCEAGTLRAIGRVAPMDLQTDSALVSILRLVLERPKFHRRKGTVRTTTPDSSRTTTVVADRWSGQWQRRDGSELLEGGPGRKVPDEVSLLMIEHLPVWGRSHDMYTPASVTRSGDDYLITAVHRGNSEVVCEVVIDASRAIARSITTSLSRIELIDSEPDL